MSGREFMIGEGEAGVVHKHLGVVLQVFGRKSALVRLSPAIQKRQHFILKTRHIGDDMRMLGEGTMAATVWIANQDSSGKWQPGNTIDLAVTLAMSDKSVERHQLESN